MHGARRFNGVDGPSVAIAHDYLTQRGGAEKVVLSMSRAFPDAPIYTLLYDRDNTYPEFADREVRVSGLNKIAPLRRNHRAALPVLPLAASALRVDADVVLTSSSGWAHGFTTRGRKLVLCHTPAHWLYVRDEYLGTTGNYLKRAALSMTSPYLRPWDRRAAKSCDQYLAVSTMIQRRIADAYGIDADVLHSPVAMGHADDAAPISAVQNWLGGAGAEPFYLCVSRLMPYKNVGEVVRAFAGTDRKLVVVGKGPERDAIERVKTPNVIMLSDLSDAELTWLYQSCRALIAASYEDFGLTPIEAGASGRPTLALRWGGFLDTVREDVTGVFFDRPEAALIAGALDRFETMRFDQDVIRQHVEQFTEERFAEKLYAAVDDLAAAPATL